MRRKQSLFAAIALSVFGMGSMAQAQNNDAVWIEAENTASTNLKIEAAGWGNSQFLSEGKWINVNIEAGKVAKDLPADGGLLSYKFNLKTNGKHEIWDRVGFEFVRSPFEWRVDGGEWNKSSPDELTVDLMPLGEWTEVAWLKLGERDMNAGDHTLDIRLTATKNEKGEMQRVLYASDAIVIAPGEFRPNGWHKPGQSGRTAADEAAAKNVFKVPAATGGARSQVSLKGQWEIARDDEQLPKEIAVPIATLPKNPNWVSIAVPSNKSLSRPELTLAHRVWYRTRVEVPANMAGRSFFLNFPKNNLNTTVYVNGQLCGFEKHPFVNFDVDVSKAIKPGVNEVMVGIRDAWYGFTHDPDRPMMLRKMFNYPASWANKGFMNLDYPVWNSFKSGILDPPTFVAAGGPAYVSDVFAQPSVAKKQLAADIEVTNPSNAPVTGEIQWEAVNVKTGKSEKTFAKKPFTVAAGQNVVVKAADAWADPQLWWPDSPTLYDLRTTLIVGGQPIDVADTRFGFREWSWEGTRFKLNGINWNMWAILIQEKTKEEWLKKYRMYNQRTMRYTPEGIGGGGGYGDNLSIGMYGKEFLNFADENGVNVRRSGALDGEVIGYHAYEPDAELRAKRGGSRIKTELMKNFREQVVAQVKGERNHPSIHIWSFENEFLFINVQNLGGSDDYEPEITKISQAITAVDPTRPNMVDGGGATKAQTLPVHGDHYVFDITDARYPDLAYELNLEGSEASGRGRWVWDQKRPRFSAEDYFTTGYAPASYAQWGGEGAFVSKSATTPAAAKLSRIISEGYRWSGVMTAFHLWYGLDTIPTGFEQSFEPRAAFIRQWDWSFVSGQKVTRTVGLFNDTRFADPLTFKWTFIVNGKTISTNTSTHNIAPGTDKKFDIVVPMPQVTARTEGQLVLTLTAANKEVFRDTKAVSILPTPTFGASAAAPAAKPAAGKPATPARTSSLQVITHTHAQMKPAANAASGVVVFDPQGNVATYLKSRGVAFTAVTSLEALPAAGKVLIVGKDAIGANESTSTTLAAYAAEGRTVIVLEQKNPLKYAALQGEMEPSTATGNVGFIEDASHPAVRNLQDKDFFTWGPNQPLYRNAYIKPTRGARSLVQSHTRLLNSALVEIPTAKGLMLLSQLTVGENLLTNGVAQTLLANLVNYGSTFKQTFREVALASGDNPQLTKAMDTLGVRYSKATDALGAISNAKVKLAVINASPANLKQLAANLPKVEAFNRAGGYIIFNNLTPEGLEDYNKIVGFDHMIRPMQRERVIFPAVRDPLLAGATIGDIVMLSGERIFGWTADEYTARDEFSYIVDYDDVAPFAKSSFFAYGNITNGFVGSDGWPLIINWELPKTENGGYGPALVPLSLPKPQTITEFTWIGNKNYWIPTKISLNSGADKKIYTVPANDEPQVLEVKPPLVGKDFTVAIEGWQERPDVRPLIGIDNIYLKAQRPADFYHKVKPMLNIGGMMHYPRGAGHPLGGGILLANLAFKDAEAVPLNAIKKRNILQTLLRNLKAPFGGGNIVVGTSVNYTPINFGDFQNKLTQYRTNRGWFGDANRTFNALQMGDQTFAGVTFNIYDFATSPVPTAIMLGGEGIPNNPPQEVKDIPIGKKADALFFLHTARIDKRRSNEEVRDNKNFEMARYIINYADGQKVTIPIYSEIDIEHYKQETAKAIPGAQTAWVSPYEGSRESAVAYMKQWNNPRPDVEIKSIDMTYGADKRGVPVLLAITAATAGK